MHKTPIFLVNKGKSGFYFAQKVPEKYLFSRNVHSVHIDGTFFIGKKSTNLVGNFLRFTGVHVGIDPERGLHILVA